MFDNCTWLKGKTVFFGVFVVALAFAAVTQHIWEDYWITFRASRNLASGHGLVYTPGERLHTFTSPLGTLIPAGLSYLTGNKNDQVVLWIYRVISATTLAAGLVLLLRVTSKLHQHRLATLLTMALVGLDAKVVDFTINGQETGLQVFFLALTIHGMFVSGARQWWRLGLGWAGLMWTRPDSCVYIAALGLSALIFRPTDAAVPTRKEWWKVFLKAGLICTAVYLPWFAWAWSYYGSPIPHTVLAKDTNLSPLTPFGLLWELLLFPFSLLARDANVVWVFMPTYSWGGGWPLTQQGVCAGLALVASLAWAIPLLRPTTRMFSLAFCLGLFFLSKVVRGVVPWYLPPAEILGYMTLGLLFDELLGFTKRIPDLGWSRGWFRHCGRVLSIVAITLMTGQAVVTVCMAREMAVQQEIIENGLRREIGLGLRENARSPNDTVFLEPLGYIGYYSQLKMLDWPGLSSKEVVETRRRLGPEKENQTYLELKPDWMVLRPFEARKVNPMVDTTHLRELYDLIKVFDASEKVAAIRWLPGRDYLKNDQTFLILRRKAEEKPKPAN